MKYPRIEKMKVSELRPADYNPRTITEDALSGLGASVDRFGMVEPPVFNRRTGTLVGGHQRLKSLGNSTKTVDVVVVDLDEIEEKALNVTLNNPEIAGTFTDGLQEILTELAEHDDIWMDTLNLDALLEEPDSNGEPDSQDSGGAGPELPDEMTFAIVVTVKGEDDQSKLLVELEGRGYVCRLLTS